jgi:hypothetical protein
MKQIVIFFAFFTITFNVFSQHLVEVETSQKNMSHGTQLAITVWIPEARSKNIEPVWKKFINNRSLGERISNLATQIGNIFKSEENQATRDRLRVEKKGDEWYVRSIEESTITRHSLDVYARMTDLPDGCQFSAFFQYTDSAFINEMNVDAERLQSLKTYIHDFGVEAYQSVVDDQIKEARKEVSTQEKVLKDIESQSKKEEKSIARAESDIQEYNAGIFEVENDIVRLDETITLKKTAFATVEKKTPEYDAGKKELKDMARQKSKYFGEIKSLKSKIKGKEEDIKSYKGKIAENENKLERQRSVIREKEQIVEQLNQKKAGIH